MPTKNNLPKKEKTIEDSLNELQCLMLLNLKEIQKSYEMIETIWRLQEKYHAKIRRIDSKQINFHHWLFNILIAVYVGLALLRLYIR